MPSYRKQTGGFTTGGRHRLGQILHDARMRQDEGYGVSLRDFADIVNSHSEYKAIDKDKLWRLENAAIVKPNAEDLAYLAPFTWSETAGRPYTVDELIAIGKEQLDPAEVGRVPHSSLNSAGNGKGQ